MKNNARNASPWAEGVRRDRLWEGVPQKNIYTYTLKRNRISRYRGMAYSLYLICCLCSMLNLNHSFHSMGFNSEPVKIGISFTIGHIGIHIEQSHFRADPDAGNRLEFPADRVIILTLITVEKVTH